MNVLLEQIHHLLSAADTEGNDLGVGPRTYEVRGPTLYLVYTLLGGLVLLHGTVGQDAAMLVHHRLEIEEALTSVP